MAIDYNNLGSAWKALGITPRRKLFLMDTCESGEVDEELIETYLTTKENGFKPKIIDESAKSDNKDLLSIENPSFIIDMDRFIYNDIFRRTGAIVFSSSSGGEASYELSIYDENGNGYENGIFTREIIEALTNPEIDKNEDGCISISELEGYVKKAVFDKTQGKQNPTIDRDNKNIKVLFPLVK